MIETRTEAAIAVANARIDAMEKAGEAFQADLTRVPTQLDRAISGLRELLELRIAALEQDLERVENRSLTNIDRVDVLTTTVRERAATSEERYSSIANQFFERDKRVDAAFAAAGQATQKIEASFTKTADAVQEVMKATSKSTDERIGDLKDRLTTMESRTIGMTTANTENRIVQTDSSARMFSLIAIVVAAAVGVGQVFTGLSNHSLAAQQAEIASHIAKAPVEARDVDLLAKEIQDLAHRLDNLSKGKQ